MLHGLPDSLQLATTPAWTRDWAAGHCQAEIGCWLILDANQLLKGLEFMRWRNSTLWQCRRTRSALLRLPADSSCEDRIHSCFSTTAKGNFHMLLFNFCIWLWYAFFWGLPHRAHNSDTSLSKSSDDKPKVLEPPRYFPYVRFHFGSDLLILRGDEFLRGFTGSLFTQSEDLGLSLRAHSLKHPQSCWLETKAQTTAPNWDFHRAWDVWQLFWLIFNYKPHTTWCAAKITETDSLKDFCRRWQKMWHLSNKIYLLPSKYNLN